MFLEACRRHYRKHIFDYRGVFSRQERFPGGLAKRQTMEFAFRQQPFSVVLRWIENPKRASAVSYVRDRWRENGKQYAKVYLNGLLSALAPTGLRLDIHGSEMMAGSRRPIDSFGLDNTLKIILEHAYSLKDDPAYEIRFAKSTRFNGRCCFLIHRLLPYESIKRYPGRLLKLYIDQEWLVPIGCFTYADDDGQTLINGYQFRDLEFNVGLTDSDFE